MDLDIAAFSGSRKKPSVVFIHGLGMDKNIWVDPVRSRILGGLFPLTVLVGSHFSQNPHLLRTLFHDLKDRNYSVIAWSQQRASNQIHAVIPELDNVVKIARDMSHAGVIIIGHSRGGLIGRKYLQVTDSPCKGLITIATPHKGSAVAKIAQYVTPLASLLNLRIAENHKSTIARAFKRIHEFLRSRALQELLPGSRFFQTLCDGPRTGVSYVSAGGTNPTLFTLSFFSFPAILEKVIPDHLFPDEMKLGKGDGLVTAESSKLPWGEEHYSFDCNHAEILFDMALRDMLVQAIERISSA